MKLTADDAQYSRPSMSSSLNGLETRQTAVLYKERVDGLGNSADLGANSAASHVASDRALPARR